MLIRASKVNSHCRVGQIGQYFSDGEYSNYLFYEVSKRFNNLLPEQNPARFSEKQLGIFRLVQSLHKYGLGYRRIAKVLNEKGLTTEEGHLWIFSFYVFVFLNSVSFHALR